MRIPSSLPCLIGLLALSLNVHAADPRPAGPATIYVGDFDLEVKPPPQMDEVADDDEIVPHRAPIRGFFDHLKDKDNDPKQQAAKLTDLMSEKLVDQLQDQGFTVQRLAPNSPLPKHGWLVKGVFTQVDEGKRLRRAMIGFGAGKTEIQVYATLGDLSKPCEPLYRVDADAEKGKMPGAVLLMNPYVAAAKFVMSKNDLEKSVKKAAGKIADDVAAKLKPVSKE